MKLHSIAFLCLILNLVSVRCAVADTWIPRPQVWVGMQGTHSGASIAVATTSAQNGNAGRLYVGSPYSDKGALAGAGAVFIYDAVPGGWTPVATLFAALPKAGAHFGTSLAYGSGHLMVGAPDYNDDGPGGFGAGAGYAEFLFDDGSTPPNIVSKRARTGTGGNFGSAIAVNIDMAAVSTVNAGGGNGCISTFHYDLATDTWNNLPASNDVVCGSTGAALGSSLAILRTSATSFLVVAGAPGESQNGNALAGAAHVYFPNPNASGGLLEVGTLAAQSPAFLDTFGTSVGIDANFVYVGATGRDNGVSRVGSVTIFKPAFIIGYNYLGEYFPGAPATIGGHCGASLSVDSVNSEFILGCPDSTGTVANEGTARVYRQFQFAGQPVWTESVLSFGNALHGADSLGKSVAIFGDHAFAGAPNYSFPPPQTGNGAWKEFVPDKIFRDGFQ